MLRSAERVEVLALLANPDLTEPLSGMARGRYDDLWRGGGTRARQQQRRLSPDQVAELAKSYVAGESIDGLAASYGVNRTTVIGHLDRRGVPRRKVVRKMTDAQVSAAAARYATGISLVDVSQEFQVCDRTLRREFAAAGVSVRPRRGRAP